MIANYAFEPKASDANPKPTGKYYVTKDSALKLAKEVVCTHFKKCGKDGAKWLSEDPDTSGKGRFDSSWSYYDVNDDGKIDAVGAIASLLRRLTRPLGSLDIQ